MHNYLENSSDASLVIVRKTDLLLKKTGKPTNVFWHQQHLCN